MRQKVKFLILGAGPSGLVFARQLQLLGEESFLILEHDADVGGLCRSQRVHDIDVDIGGGHFLDSRNTEATSFLFSHLPVEGWKKYSRISHIETPSGPIDYPFEANIWQFPIHEQIRHLDALARAGSVVGMREPPNFNDWLRWKFGDAIADDYLLPYNRKLWGPSFDGLGVYWVSKLPNVSFRETLESCLLRRPRGVIPAHAEFYYPITGGYGSVWRTIASKFEDRIALSVPVRAIEDKTINGTFAGSIIINTIPWTVWAQCGNLPRNIMEDCRGLAATSVDVDLYLQRMHSPAQWVYISDEKITYHRILNMSNFGRPRCAYCTETNSMRNIRQDKLGAIWRHTNEYAYPVPLFDKPKRISRILEWARSKGVYGLGRWGEWEHYNSDVCVSRALALAKRLVLIS